jgi:kinesin family protein 5
MAKMMAGFDLGDDVFSTNERKLQGLISRVDALHEVSAAGETIAPDDVLELRTSLLETQGFIRQAELTMNDRGEFGDLQDSRRTELEQKLEDVQKEYEDLLSRNLGDGDVEEIRERLEKSFISRKDTEAAAVDELRAEITRKDEEMNKLRQNLVDTESRTSSNGTASKTLQQQISEFDAMKKSLMRDLQNRCERVVELEISLDDAREQYNNVLRSSNNRAQQKKMAFLERNLEQLTHVQRQLVEQNSSLKKEVAIAERKLIARNERIASLESLLQESQEKLTQANHRYVSFQQNSYDHLVSNTYSIHRFEAQLTAVKERLEAAKQGSTRGLPTMDGNGSFSFGGSRIAKPLRGGGGSDGPPPNANVAGVQSQETTGKRTSWFFGQDRK